MIKVGLIGFGDIGKIHLNNYKNLAANGLPVKQSAISDVNYQNIIKDI